MRINRRGLRLAADLRSLGVNPITANAISARASRTNRGASSGSTLMHPVTKSDFEQPSKIKLKNIRLKARPIVVKELDQAIRGRKIEINLELDKEFEDSNPIAYDHGIGVNRNGVRYWADLKNRKLILVLDKKGKSVQMLDRRNIDEFDAILLNELEPKDPEAYGKFVELKEDWIRRNIP